MNYEYNTKNNFYICDYEKAKKFINLLHLDKIAEENIMFSVEILNTTVILFKN